MNITFPTMNTSYRSAVSVRQRHMPAPQKAKGDYDTVSIRRAQASPDDEETFARVLARRTAAQLDTASQERVQELKRQVANGAYVPDPQRIAGRMLGLG